MVIKRLLLTFVAFIFLIASCKTIQEEKKVDYNDALSVLYEASRVEEKIKEEKLLEALSIAKNLHVNRSDIEETGKAYALALEITKARLNELIIKKDWQKAKLFFDSIKTCDPLFQEIDEKSLISAVEDDLYKGSSFKSFEPKNKDILAKTIDQMIDATITVFVDKGIKIEKGLGYSDIILGSGFFIDEAGHFITNYHVIQSEVDPKYEGYSKLYIKNLNGSKDKIPAKVIGYDPLLDLALVKAQVKPSYILNLGSSASLKIGSKIYAIGSPLGLERTITSGIVSSKERELLSLVDVIQIDAAINHGSSGGPIVDENGNVEAVVFAGVTRTQGLNFAIPVELLKAVLPSLYKGGENSHAWLGCYEGKIKMLDIHSEPSGTLASYVMPRGPASDAGVVDGAIITKINGRKIKDLKDLKTQMLHLPPGRIVKLEGQVKDKDVWKEKEWYPILQQRPEYPAFNIYKIDTIQRCLLPFFGIYLEYTGSKRYYRVKDVLPYSYGDEAGFMVNDYMEVRNMRIDEDKGVIESLFYAKKLKAAYIESYIGASTYADSPSYF